MARGFLLDVHIPVAVVSALQRSLPGAEVEHIARWRHGSFRMAPDDVILTAAIEEDLVFVTCDVHTVAPLADAWTAVGRSFPGIALLPGERVSLKDVGWVAGALEHLHRQPELLDPAYPVVYLQAP